MRAVVQRVTRAQVTISGDLTGKIEKGLMVLLGVAEGDTSADVQFMVNKIIGLRIFEDAEEKMNLALADVKGSMLVVSQFTLLGDCRQGRRPSFITAARPETANALYEEFVAAVRAQGIEVGTGRFQQYMQVELVNDGPVTILVDSKKTF